MRKLVILMLLLFPFVIFAGVELSETTISLMEKVQGDVNLPYVYGLNNIPMQLYINHIVQDDFSLALSQLYKYAEIEAAEFEKMGWGFRPYKINVSHKVTYNKGKYLSFYVDFYQYTGGAHGMTFRTAYTFDLSRGRITNLSELFACRYDFKEAIVKEINRQLKEILKTEPQKFFISEIKDLSGTGFYLENDNLVIYYGLYEIAPYVEGIVEFSVPFELFGDKLLISTTEE